MNVLSHAFFPNAVAVLLTVLLSMNIVSAEEKRLTKQAEPHYTEDVMETTPVLWQGREILFSAFREKGIGYTEEQLYLFLADLKTKERLTRFGAKHSLACAFVDGDVFHVFAAYQPTKESWFTDINHFKSTDLKNWETIPALKAENEHLLNSSVCRDEQGYIMAYESDSPVAFCCKFARSKDLDRWEKAPNLVFAGKDGKSYSACPVIRYVKPYYYVIYLRHAGTEWVSDMIRSKDLRIWEFSPKNPVLQASEGEGINNSDVDLFETDGETRLLYATGNQNDWAHLREAVFPGTMKEFFESYYPEGEPHETVDAERK